MKRFLEGWGSGYQETDIKDGKSPILLIKDFSTKNLKKLLNDLAIQNSSQEVRAILEKTLIQDNFFAWRQSKAETKMMFSWHERKTHHNYLLRKRT
ncbi:MAG: hypothetical protein I3273_04515 [Candidatus Moeniiplasma glomeromycotorum]|nr:hypothetical protein [Candidatus Moeniiplasma glomeromycotorum]MCE8169358.1 hypothetical protein [Candidatus Moeniiplasma glomeromycotorum]